MEAAIKKQNLFVNYILKVMADDHKGFSKIRMTVRPENYSPEWVSRAHDSDLEAHLNLHIKKRILYSEACSTGKKPKFTSVHRQMIYALFKKNDKY